MTDALQPAAAGPQELITAVVQRGRADKIVKAALAAGAGGATVYFARGMGVRERLGLLGLAIVPEKEVVLVVSPAADTDRILDAMVQAGDLDAPGHGIAFVSPVRRTVGLHVRAADGAKPAG